MAGQADRKIYAFEEEAHKKIEAGLRIGADVAGSTLGPSGKNVLIERKFRTPLVVDDGYTAINSLILEDPLENLGVSSLVDAANKASEYAGDGPQPLDSKVLTPEGFKNMGDIIVGDVICGTEGSNQVIQGVFPKGKKQVYKVKFNNGREMKCCKDHLWTVITAWGVKKIITTQQLIDNGLYYNKGEFKNYKYYVPLDFAEFYSKELPLDPYLVGILIGDGSLSMDDSTEISLGINKEHIIEKIILPEGLSLSVNFDELKNYFRVKIIGKTLTGKTIRDLLKEIGLQGLKSDTKFIPKTYLYNDFQSRLSLLQGLSDTDGHINERGLLEYSTINKNLYLGILELLRGLGKDAFSYLLKRKDGSSYSNKSIYRISELKGYKYGNKIIEIEPIDEIVEMQCIKVSNSDNLYFTDDYILTHNTSTTIVLTRAIYEAGRKLVGTGPMSFGQTPLEIKNAILKAKDEVVSKLRKFSKKVETKEDMKAVALAAYADEKIAETVADMTQKVGENGIIIVEEGWGRETETELLTGMRFAGKLAHGFFANTPEAGLNLEGLPILVTDFDFVNLNDLAALGREVANQGESGLIIVANRFERPAIEQIIRSNIANIQNKVSFKVYLVKTPSFTPGEFEDLAVYLGAVYFSKERGDKILECQVADLGRTSKFNISVAGDGIAIGGNGSKAMIDYRIADLKKKLADEKVKMLKGRIEQRIAALASAIGIIKVASPSEAETENIRLKTRNAVKSVSAAVKEGMVRGGGQALKEIADDLPENNILKDALKVPYEQIQRNAGGKLEILEIYDALKVVRTAIEQACSQAWLLINTSTAIAFRGEPDRKDAAEALAQGIQGIKVGRKAGEYE